MTRLVTEAVVDVERLDDVLRPRQSFVLEEPAGDGTFRGAEGPVRTYSRRVETEPLPDGQVRVRQVVDYTLAVPYFAFVFLLPSRRFLRKLHEPKRAPWWAPPQRADARAAAALGTTALLSYIAGYMGTILTQTITFAADDFGTGKGAQGVALALVRADVVLTVLIVALADRRGRRSVLLKATAVACVLTATGALAPSLAWLAASQVVARGFVTAALIVIAIVVVEEMPAGSRAYALSVLALAAGGGAGLCVVLLQVCDVAPWGWRILFAVPLVAVPIVRHAARHMPESRRFRAPHGQAGMAGHGRRFWLLAVSAFLLNLFVAPASQFQNEYLRTEQGFSAARISLFTVLTGTPGFLGIVVGGRLAEHSRRLVGAVAVVVGVGGTLLVYLSSGWSIWAWSLLASVVGAATVPALGVYGPELFPTGMRGRANGIITALARVGSVVGLLVAGWMGDRSGRLGSGLALLAIGPALLAVLVLVAYPETAHRELEELNPEDRVA
ncbi:MAG TPA: MFS transporter [Acidimicrobiales bacterium]|nr:MFS transporter [Acidimicrobiales bacterium]